MLWSTLSGSRWSPTALQLTETGVKVLLHLLVPLKSTVVVLGIGLRLDLAILVSRHTLLPYIQIIYKES